MSNRGSTNNAVRSQRLSFTPHLFNPAEDFFHLGHISVLLMEYFQLAFGQELGSQHHILQKLTGFDVKDRCQPHLILAAIGTDILQKELVGKLDITFL